MDWKLEFTGSQIAAPIAAHGKIRLKYRHLQGNIQVLRLFSIREGSSKCLPDSCLSDMMGVYPTQMCIRPIVRFAADAIHDRPLSVEAHWAGRCVTAVLQKAGIYN